MEKSESIKQIATAMINFNLQVQSIPKNSENPFYKSKYAKLDDILPAIKKPLADNKLSFMQFPEGENELTTIIMHESGEYISAKYYMKPVKSDPQSFGSVITYQRRYALGAILGLNIDDDDDANSVSKPDNRPWLEEKQKNGIVDLMRAKKPCTYGTIVFNDNTEIYNYFDKKYLMKKTYRDELIEEQNSKLNQ